jgi:predicted  nucleic acid-binding Zn-ribbon protein
VKYGDMVYSAVLEYRPGQTIEIRAPRTVTTVGKPVQLDLSQVELSLTEDGIGVDQVIADGRYYSGVFALTSGNNLQVAGVARGRKVTAPAEDLEALQREISRLERTIERRDARIERLNEQMEEMPEEERVANLREQVNELEDKLQQRESRIANIEEELASSESDVSQLENTVEAREDRIDRLERQMEEMPEEERVKELRRQISELEDELENRNQRIATLQNRVGDMRTEDWQTAPERLDRVLLSSFRNGSVGTGQWQTSSAAVTQNDAGALFAKFVVPVRQGNNELYYRFIGRALGSGRQGYGLHFLADDANTAGGYGYGDSYLVWVTQDVANYQNQSAYVQLYRSYDDIRMVELQSTAVDDVSIGRSGTVEVHVNRERNMITVVVNDEPVISYQADQLIFSGREVAVRTMGTAVVRDLQIRSAR